MHVLPKVLALSTFLGIVYLLKDGCVIIVRGFSCNLLFVAMRFSNGLVSVRI